LHLLRRCTEAEDLKYAVKGVEFYQEKGCDFSHRLCSHFINLCVQAKTPQTVSNIILQPKHRLGAWISQKSVVTLLISLVEAGEIDMLLDVAKVPVKKGLPVHTLASIRVCLGAIKTAAQYEAVMQIAQKTLSEDDVSSLKAEFPPIVDAPESAEVAVEAETPAASS
jgi:hypothetical protein